MPQAKLIPSNNRPEPTDWIEHKALAVIAEICQTASDADTLFVALEGQLEELTLDYGSPVIYQVDDETGDLVLYGIENGVIGEIVLPQIWK